MKKNLLIATLMMAVAVSLTALPAAFAADCKTPGALLDLMKKISQECKNDGGTDLKNCVEDPSKYAKLVRAWNSFVGNGPLHIGPRQIEFGVAQRGNLVAPGDRRFISEPLDKDSVTISVKKTGEGKAICELSICKVDANGVVTNIGSFTFPSDAPVGKEFSQTFTGVKACALDVLLNGKGGIGARFPMEFKATK
ncbi:MAG TPA: hypothetical protein VNN73_15240 [Blastocatellia bacterium]|nr:hypothetical protein [Blastocatellia bacterium]